MSVVTGFAVLVNRNVFKTMALSTRCMSWCSSYLKNSSHQSVNHLHLCFVKKLPVITFSNYLQCRLKYDKRKKDDVDDEELQAANEEFRESVDGKDTKVATVRVTSLRMDLLIKSGLGLARNKVETAFFDSRIRVNGVKVPKKSISLRVGDEVDVIKEISPMNNDHLIVSRIEILSATANEDDISVTMRKFKSLTIENYSGQNIYKSSSN